MIHKLSDDAFHYSFQAAGTCVYVAQASISTRQVFFDFQCSLEEAAQLWSELVNSGATVVSAF